MITLRPNQSSFQETWYTQNPLGKRCGVGPHIVKLEMFQSFNNQSQYSTDSQKNLRPSDPKQTSSEIHQQDNHSLVTIFKTLHQKDARFPDHLKADDIRTWMTQNQKILDDITILNLNKQKLQTVPEEIRYFRHLKYINLSENKLTTLPKSIASLPELHSIDLYHNRLTELPAWISKIIHLKGLYVYDNQLTTLPESIRDLKNLRSLGLSRNQFTKLPASTLALSPRCSVSAKNNPFTEEYLEEFRQRLLAMNPMRRPRFVLSIQKEPPQNEEPPPNKNESLSLLALSLLGLFLNEYAETFVHELAHAIAMRVLFLDVNPSIRLFWLGGGYTNSGGPMQRLSSVGAFLGENYSMAAVYAAGPIGSLAMAGLQTFVGSIAAKPWLKNFLDASRTCTLIRLSDYAYQDIIAEKNLHCSRPGDFSEFCKYSGLSHQLVLNTSIAIGILGSLSTINMIWKNC